MEVGEVAVEVAEEVAETTGGQGEVLAMRELTEPRWVELVIGCLVITLVIMEVEEEEITGEVVEEEVVVMGATMEVEDLVGEGVEEGTVMSRLLNSKATSCSKMVTYHLEDAMVVVVEEEGVGEVASTMEVVEEAGTKAMEANMMASVEGMEEVEVAMECRA